MEKEYIATCSSSGQMTEDHWEMFYPAFKVTEDTTMREIVQWYKIHNPKSLLELRIREVERMPPIVESKEDKYDPDWKPF